MAKKKQTLGIGPDRDWEVEDALRALMRAEEIKKDKKMMARVKALATERLKEVASIAGASEGDPD